MTLAFVIDTNVGIVANDRHSHAGLDCVEACTTALIGARNGIVLVDEGSQIIDEYRRHLSHSGQPGVGDAFFKWLWDNQGNPKNCRMIAITPKGSNNFEEFPIDPGLNGFDPADRKFVAVALASGLGPEILNASDTDWWNFRAVLANNNVTVIFLCPQLMNRGRN